MDFPQQYEETFALEQSIGCDVLMESPLYPPAGGAVERKFAAGKQRVDSGANLADKMNSSMNSTLEDTTPSDSGVQMLDSESSELMMASITSQNGFDFEEPSAKVLTDPYDTQCADAHDVNEKAAKVEANNDAVPRQLPLVDNNSNVAESQVPVVEDVMATSALSTFDTTESIVYRRKVRKTSSAPKAPKKRVSFHEDILKNTRTDNIHIEHGFITYKNGRKTVAPAAGVAGRYSWCSGERAEGASAAAATAAPTELYAQDDEAGGGVDGRRQRCVVYRNACSDVLDYGNSDVYDTHESSNCLRYVDNSGVFEYVPQTTIAASGTTKAIDGLPDGMAAADGQVLYRCSCSSSNSSLDLDENDKNSNRPEYAQAKSSSCDCIGMSNAANNNFIGDNCYFSEPNIDNLSGESASIKSVWNKEKMPKSSCLKKTTRRHTHVIYEQDLSTKMKKFNVHDMNQLLDNSSKIIIGSLKSIFTLPLTERGLPEGSEDLQAVVECVPALEHATPEHRVEETRPTSPPPLKAKPFLSKSLDGTKQHQQQQGPADGGSGAAGKQKFVHNVDEQLRRKNSEEMYAPTRQSSGDNGHAQSMHSTVISPAAMAAQAAALLQSSADAGSTHKTLTRQEELVADADTLVRFGFGAGAGDGGVNDPGETPAAIDSRQFRNKFIINCESTVFEHTGVSYCYDAASHFGGVPLASPQAEDIDDGDAVETPIAEAEPPQQLRTGFSSTPIGRTFSNFFRSFKDSSSSSAASASAAAAAAATKRANDARRRTEKEAADNYFALKMKNKEAAKRTQTAQQLSSTTSTTSSSTVPDLLSPSGVSNPSTSSSSLPASGQAQKSNASLVTNVNQSGHGHSQSNNNNSSQSNSLVLGQELRGQLEKQSRHLPSPLKKRSSAGNLIQQQQLRYGIAPNSGFNPPTTTHDYGSQLLSPDIFNAGFSRGSGGGRDSKSTILSDEFDDILTITTTEMLTSTTTTTTTTASLADAKRDDGDMVIVDYPDFPTAEDDEEEEHLRHRASSGQLLKPPVSAAPPAKTSLINRFLRNVTQKKLLADVSMRRNNFFAGKLRQERKLFAGELYVRGARPQNYELIDDLNAEIAMEIEMSAGANSPRRELVVSIENRSAGGELPGDMSRFDLGIGEISIDIFNGNYLHILRDPAEQLMKVFKLYTGYSREGHMTPVLVFLTDRTLYVTDLVRNRLCAKFVLAYVELDVILMGPYGNTVLLSNSARDMQQVLLAGGPYPADALVSNLELCARRSGSTLPAVGQLTLEHLAPLRSFVCSNSSVARVDEWMYYAVVNVPAGSLGSGDEEPLGPHVKGFLMHRRLKEQQAYTVGGKHGWHPGYFLLKAGVLYMFNDSMQKLPSWAMALAECQGARRAAKAGRPHCFEILLKGQLLQLAAPDEYVASEWLQALLQSASGLFEMQEKHKTLGCSLVVTANHLITLREDFTAPLRQINRSALKPNEDGHGAELMLDECNAGGIGYGGNAFDVGSVLSSTMSTPTRGTQRSCSSLNSTPTKLSQLSARSTATNNTLTSTTTSASNTTTTTCSKQTQADLKESYTNMSSVYGKNSGLEILTCADIKEMTGIKIPSHNDAWWCVLEFSCQEVRECSDDLVIFFASSSEMQRFLRLLERLWQAKNLDLFPITVLDEDDVIAEQCTALYMDVNRSWEPLLTAALGYPL